MSTEPTSVGHSNYPFIQKVIESKCTDVALITSFVALLIIGILASSGVFNFMGTTNAAYLSYGMYAGAGLLFLLEAIKCVANRCTNNRASNVVEPDVPNPDALTSEELLDLENKAVLYANDDNAFKRSDGSNIPYWTHFDHKSQAKSDTLVLIRRILAKAEFRNNPASYMENTYRVEFQNQEVVYFIERRAYWFVFNELKQIRTLNRPDDLLYWGRNEAINL